MTEATTPTQRPASRPKPAKATRYVAAGAAVGATFVLAGGMAAAASASADSSPPAPAIRQVVVESPGATSPASIVIVLPSNDPTVQLADILPDIVSAIEVPANPEPARAVAATPTPTPAQPVTESGGS